MTRWALDPGKAMSSYKAEQLLMSFTTAHVECVLAKDPPQGLKGAHAHDASEESLAAITGVTGISLNC